MDAGVFCKALVPVFLTTRHHTPDNFFPEEGSSRYLLNVVHIYQTSILGQHKISFVMYPVLFAGVKAAGELN
jgi:hypothetical protein